MREDPRLEWHALFGYPALYYICDPHSNIKQCPFPQILGFNNLSTVVLLGLGVYECILLVENI